MVKRFDLSLCGPRAFRG